MKYNVNQIMDEVVSIQNQISGLQALLKNRKLILGHYFDKSGNRTVSNDECTAYVREATEVVYDVKSLKEKLDPELFNFCVETTRTIHDWNAFVEMCKEHGIKPSDLKPLISVDRKVDSSKLNTLYEQNKLKVSDIEGCYQAKVTKSIVLKMKNVDKEIPIKK